MMDTVNNISNSLPLAAFKKKCQFDYKIFVALFLGKLNIINYNII